MKTKIFADANLRVGEIDRNLFGSFIEHLGRAVYEGIYESGIPRRMKTASARTSSGSSAS